jgi:magnesium chelatase subunit D
MPESREARGTTIEDLIIAAAEARPPEELLRRSSQFRIRGLQGKRSKARSQTHGRYTGSTLRRRDGARIAVDATLRAAAPFQKRREGGATTRVKVKPDDLRFKKLRGRSGVLFIFVVDASGSMALNRMAQAKGALIRLLHDAYLHRDTVGLIALRGQSAEVLLPPTRSIDLARRVVDSLPAGGATPLAAGLMKAVEMAGSARLRRQCEVVALVFTDGRANVGLMRDESAVLGTDELIEQELRQIGALLHCKEINAAVIDTKSRFVSAGEGRKLADLLGARYLYLPRANGDELYKAVTAVAERSDSRQ